VSHHVVDAQFFERVFPDHKVAATKRSGIKMRINICAHLGFGSLS
jgi:hypothetical protein